MERQSAHLLQQLTVSGLEWWGINRNSTAVKSKKAPVITLRIPVCVCVCGYLSSKVYEETLQSPDSLRKFNLYLRAQIGCPLL